MKLPVVWLPEADVELKEAWTRYDGIRPELGQRFAGAVADTVDRIAAAPLSYAVVEKRRIVVIACFHGRRDPGQWQGR